MILYGLFASVRWFPDHFYLLSDKLVAIYVFAENLLLLAGLVGNAAAGLAGALAGGLAFAAAAGFQALGQVPGLQGLDSLHGKLLLSIMARPAGRRHRKSDTLYCTRPGMSMPGPEPGCGGGEKNPNFFPKRA